MPEAKTPSYLLDFVKECNERRKTGKFSTQSVNYLQGFRVVLSINCV